MHADDYEIDRKITEEDTDEEELNSPLEIVEDIENEDSIVDDEFDTQTDEDPEIEIDSECEELEIEVEPEDDGEHTLISDIYDNTKTSKIELTTRRKGLPRHFGLKTFNSSNTESRTKYHYKTMDIRKNTLDYLRTRLSLAKECTLIEKCIFNSAIVNLKKTLYDGEVRRSHLHHPVFIQLYLSIAYDTYVTLSTSQQQSKFEPYLKSTISDLKEFKIGFDSIEFRDQKFIDDKETNHILEPLNVKEGIHTCSKCKNTKTYFYQLQLRSCDEPMTTFILCTVCGNKWRV